MVQNNYSGGNATVLTPFLSGITNTVAKQQQILANQQVQEAKRLQQEQQQLTDIVKKVNVNGVQKQHLPEITSKLEKIYDTYYKASKTESRQEKLALRLELEKGITELGADVALSKDYGQKFAKIGEQFATKPELYSAEARKQYAENFNKPLSQLNGTETNLQTYISPDTSILGKTEDPLIKGLWTRASEKTTYGKTVGVGQTGDRVTETFKTKSINPDDVGKELFRAYGDNSGYKNIIDLQAEQLGMTPQQVLLERTKAIVDLNKPMVEQGQFRNSKPTKSGGGSDTVYTGTYRQQNVEGLLEKSTDTLGRVKAQLLPTAEVGYVTLAKDNKDYIRIKTPRDKEKRTGGKVIFIAVDDPNAPTKLNTYLSLATGEEVSPSKFGIQKGKTTGELEELRLRNKTAPKNNTTSKKKTISGF